MLGRMGGGGGGGVCISCIRLLGAWILVSRVGMRGEGEGEGGCDGVAFYEVDFFCFFLSWFAVLLVVGTFEARGKEKVEL